MCPCELLQPCAEACSSAPFLGVNFPSHDLGEFVKMGGRLNFPEGFEPASSVGRGRAFPYEEIVPSFELGLSLASYFFPEEIRLSYNPSQTLHVFTNFTDRSELVRNVIFVRDRNSASSMEKAANY